MHIQDKYQYAYELERRLTISEDKLYDLSAELKFADADDRKRINAEIKRLRTICKKQRAAWLNAYDTFEAMEKQEKPVHLLV